jgi:CBS domain-containing protein
MIVDELMTRDVRTCRLHDSLAEAARILWEHDCGCALVVDAEGRSVAVITDRDICMAAYTRGLPLRAMSVASAASGGGVSVHPGEKVETPQVLMRRHRVRRLPVVDAMGKPIGIVSMNDLARRSHQTGRRDGGLSSESIVDTLAAIGERRDAAAVMVEAAQ